jgi:type II secretion system protein N
MKNRFITILLYGLYAVFALGVFLYLRFPSELIKKVLSAQVQQIDPLAQLNTDDVSLTIPPGLKLAPLAVSYADIPILHLDRLKITPSLFSLLQNNKRFAFKGVVGDGEIFGQADTSVEHNGLQAQGVVNLARVPLQFLEIINRYQGFKPDGEMDAKINFDTSRGAGTADVNLEISPASIAMDPPLMGLATLEFNRIKAQLTVSPRMAQIRSCEASGDQLDGKLTGSIVFRQPLRESRVTLSLTLKPQPGFIADHKNDMIGGMLASGTAQTRGLVFRISGTLNNPTYVIR